ncbi:MAG: redoxin domain-containing protein, partial [Pirellulales bacterium]|nr:redoxin domain-containing protein [Pirellulales bacterium]
MNSSVSRFFIAAVLVGTLCFMGPGCSQVTDATAGVPATSDSDATIDEIDLIADGKVETTPVVYGEAHPFPVRRPAPKLDGGIAWLNSAGPIDLQDLRGKFVLLDFWTYCCINCIQVLPELKKLEEKYPNELVVIGVHSAKFDTEKNTENIREAILRYEIKHPVVNDAEHKIWNNYFVNSWPSFRIIDPEGNLVGGDSGEIEFEAFDGFMKRFLPYYKRRGLLDTTPLKFDLESYKERQTPLRFPGKVLAD